MFWVPLGDQGRRWCYLPGQDTGSLSRSENTQFSPQPIPLHMGKAEACEGGILCMSSLWGGFSRGSVF